MMLMGPPFAPPPKNSHVSGGGSIQVSPQGSRVRLDTSQPAWAKPANIKRIAGARSREQPRRSAVAPPTLPDLKRRTWVGIAQRIRAPSRPARLVSVRNLRPGPPAWPGISVPRRLLAFVGPRSSSSALRRTEPQGAAASWWRSTDSHGVSFERREKRESSAAHSWSRPLAFLAAAEEVTKQPIPEGRSKGRLEGPRRPP